MKLWTILWCVIESTFEISLPWCLRNWTASSITIGFTSLTYRSQIFLCLLIFFSTTYNIASVNSSPLIPEREDIADDYILLILVITYWLIIFSNAGLRLKFIPPMAAPWVPVNIFILLMLLGPPKREAPDICRVASLELVFLFGLLLESESKLPTFLR